MKEKEEFDKEIDILVKNIDDLIVSKSKEYKPKFLLFIKALNNIVTSHTKGSK